MVVPFCSPTYIQLYTSTYGNSSYSIFSLTFSFINLLNFSNSVGYVVVSHTKLCQLTHWPSETVDFCCLWAAQRLGSYQKQTAAANSKSHHGRFLSSFSQLLIILQCFLIVIFIKNLFPNIIVIIWEGLSNQSTLSLLVIILKHIQNIGNCLLRSSKLPRCSYLEPSYT